MQQALERALDRADSIIESVRQRPPKRTCSASGEKSLHHKLYDIYAEECEKEPEGAEELRSSVNLLEKLVAREALPRVVVNLYPGEQGYSLMLQGTDEACSETVRMRYEEGELLQYLDAEQLPPVLLDLLEKSEMNLFHRGCVLAEVRDYRQRGPGAPPGYQSRHVLLRPTMQTLAADVQAIAGAHPDWTQDDRLLLESQLILATAEPLCLDPSVTVACTENRLLYDKQKMNTHPMTRSLRRFSMASLARERARPPRPPPPQLSALASWKKSKASKAAPQYDLKICKVGHCVDLWKRRPCELAVPSAVDVEKYAKGRPSGPRAGSRPSARPVAGDKEDSAPGAEAGSAAQTARPTFPRPGNDPLSSAERPHTETRRERQMSLPGDPSADDHSSLDTDAGRVDSRSEELVPKKAPCPVKMSSSPRGSTSLSQFSPGKAAHQPDTTLVQSSVLQKGVTHLPSPLQLLPSSGKSSSGNIFIPEHASSILQSLPSAPTSKPPSAPQKSSMEVSQVHKIPPATSFTVNSSEGMTVLSTFTSSQKLVWSPLSASRRIQTLSTAISSQRTPATPVMATSTGQDIINVVGPVLGAQTLASGSHPIQGSTPGAIAPARVKPSGVQPPNVQPGELQQPAQVGPQLFLKTASGLRPVTLIQVPPGSVLLKTQQQKLYQVTTHQQLLPISTAHPQQPVPQGSSAQDSSSQTAALFTQQHVVFNLTRGGSLQSQPSVLSQLGPHQGRPRQSLPQQRFQQPSALQQPQQIQQLRILQQPGAVVTTATSRTQPPQPPQTASLSTGHMDASGPFPLRKMKRTLGPAAPKDVNADSGD